MLHISDIATATEAVDIRGCNPALGSNRKAVTPIAALDGSEKRFDLSVEGRRLFQVNRVTGVRTDSKTRIGKDRFEHQVGLKAATVLFPHGEQHRRLQVA